VKESHNFELACLNM